MISYIGDFAEDATVIHYFNTFTSDDPSASVTITNLALTDIYVYKDGSITDIVTDGATVTIDFDGRTGVHKLTIDTSIDAAYSTGSDYMVLVEGTTVDAGTITAGIFTFSIENRFDAAADDLANVTDGLGALKTLIDAIKTETVLIVEDTNELQVDDIPTTLTAIITDLDDIKGTSFVKDTHSLIDLKTETVLILADTDDIGVAGAGLTAINLPNQTMDIVGNITGNLSGSVGSVTGAVGSVTGAVGSVTGNVGGNVTGSVGSNLELGPTEVNAEVVDVMKTDTIAERGQGAPTSTPTFEEALSYMYMMMTNKIDVDSGFKEFNNNAGTVIWKKALSDDASNYVEANGVTGP